MTHLECMWYRFAPKYVLSVLKFFFGIELLLFEKNEVEQKLNLNKNAHSFEQLLYSLSNCSNSKAIARFVHTAPCVLKEGLS